MAYVFFPILFPFSGSLSHFPPEQTSLVRQLSSERPPTIRSRQQQQSEGCLPSSTLCSGFVEQKCNFHKQQCSTEINQKKSTAKRVIEWDHCKVFGGTKCGSESTHRDTTCLMLLITLEIMRVSDKLGLYFNAGVMANSVDMWHQVIKTSCQRITVESQPAGSDPLHNDKVWSALLLIFYSQIPFPQAIMKFVVCCAVLVCRGKKKKKSKSASQVQALTQAHLYILIHCLNQYIMR